MNLGIKWSHYRVFKQGLGRARFAFWIPNSGSQVEGGHGPESGDEFKRQGQSEIDPGVGEIGKRNRM